MTEFLYIDRAGRVVIPKPLRERYGLGPGRRLELIDTGDEIHLRPETTGSGVVRLSDGSLEFTGHLAAGFDILQAIADVRDQRSVLVLGDRQ